MKRFLALLLFIVVFLTGCNSQKDINKAMQLRQSILKCKTCSFDIEITADYTDKLYTFRMSCKTDATGKLDFTVTAPESVAGISGTIDGEEGALQFDDQILTFDLLTDGLVTPISAPWLLVRTLRGGYISSGGKDGDLFKIQIDDSYEDNPLRLDVWLDNNNYPVFADSLWDGCRVVSVTVENFILQ